DAIGWDVEIEDTFPIACNFVVESYSKLQENHEITGVAQLGEEAQIKGVLSRVDFFGGRAFSAVVTKDYAVSSCYYSSDSVFYEDEEVLGRKGSWERMACEDDAGGFATMHKATSAVKYSARRWGASYLASVWLDPGRYYGEGCVLVSWVRARTQEGAGWIAARRELVNMVYKEQTEVRILAGRKSGGFENGGAHISGEGTISGSKGGEAEENLDLIGGMVDEGAGGEVGEEDGRVTGVGCSVRYDALFLHSGMKKQQKDEGDRYRQKETIGRGKREAEKASDKAKASGEEDDEKVNNETCLVAQASSEICLGVDLEPDEWIKDSGCSKHMTGNRKLFSSYKAYNGGNVIFGSNLRGNIIGKGHANMRLIQSLASKELVRNLPKLKFDQHFCDACKIGKQAHASHKAKNIVSTTRCLELLHIDLFGPSVIRSYGGNRYTQVIVDDYSRNLAEDDIFFNQSKYIKEMLKKFGLEDSKPMKTPMSSDTKLTKDEECESVDSTKYRGMIGSLLYLTASGPDIMFSVCLCALFQKALKTSHLEAVKCIFGYIKGTTHLGLWYPKGTSIETVVYADSNHAGDYVDRKSTSGICTFVGCCLTSWFSKKQTALAISTTEAEYVSAKKACQQALWMKQALIGYDVRLDDVPIMYDNKGVIDLSKNPMKHSRTKHIEICHNFLRDNVQK
ncbi:hypothetical protein Tco_0763669, partial [Tanacetum coccineum]